ncbi:hypothetical protein [Methylobacterium oryzisoli]|uniref:hypothetical protein n=1 Tax=Methylobacterium oryzisoli TaxID=3385502 RepID=UPI003892BDC5
MDLLLAVGALFLIGGAVPLFYGHKLVKSAVKGTRLQRKGRSINWDAQVSQ